MTEQTLAVLRTKNRAFRWPKDVSGNPDGHSRVYHVIMRGRGVNYNRCSARVQTTEVRAVTEQTLAVLRAKNRAFRWPKGVSGNPDGQSRVYHECRRLARAASPAMMKVLIDLAADPEADQRVRSVCAVARPRRHPTDRQARARSRAAPPSLGYEQILAGGAQVHRRSAPADAGGSKRAADRARDFVARIRRCEHSVGSSVTPARPDQLRYT